MKYIKYIILLLFITSTAYAAGTVVDFSSQINATAGTGITFTNDAISITNDWTADQGATNIHAGNYTDTNTTYTGGTNLTLAGTIFNVDDAFLANDGDTGTGVYDFGGATSLEIPNAADPTVNASGEVAVNTTAASSSIRYYDGTAERALYPWGFGGLSYASSTLSYIGSYGAAGTTTILIFNAPTGLTLTDMYCKTDTGTAVIHFEDGTNDTDSLVCTSSGVEDDGTIANNTWTKWEDFKISIGTQTGDPNVITITPVIRKDAN